MITGENKGFIKEIVHDQFGPPSIIKGVPTYSNSAPIATAKIATTTDTDSKPIPTVTTTVEPWTPKTIRSGVIARKIGQYPLWKKDGTKIRTTLLQVLDNHVVKYKKPPSKGRRKYGYLLVGAESADPSLLTKEYCGIFQKAGVMPKKTLSRFLVSQSAALQPGTALDVTHFRVGDYVDVRGKTVDRGFQGVCKRWGFKGMPASHGVTKTHRRPGNIGAGGQKARVWPGTKMPGHMGNKYRICRGLKIWRINTKYNVMWVTGSAIPGETNNLVRIYDTMLPLRKSKTAPPFPTSDPDNTTWPEDIWSDEIHDFRESSILYKNE